MKIPEKSELKIYIDSSKRDEKKVSLVKVSDGIENVIDEKIGDIDVVSSIKEILSKNNLDLNDISEFDPNLGPGSFTVLKIGVTVANVFNWLLGRKDIDELDIPEYGGEPNISEPKRKEPTIFQ